MNKKSKPPTAGRDVNEDDENAPPKKRPALAVIHAVPSQRTNLLLSKEEYQEHLVQLHKYNAKPDSPANDENMKV